MLSPDQENALREKISKHICHRNGCMNAGVSRVTITFADANRKQITVPAWECNSHR